MSTLVKATLVSLLLTGCAAAHVTEQKPVKTASEKSYGQHDEAKLFINEMVAEGFERPYLEKMMMDAERQDSIIKAISKPAERRLNWGEYRNIFLGKSRVDQGVEFWEGNAETLKRASETYGVPEEIIVAIIGVETRYGRHAGNYRVLDALTTLAFDYPPRGKFFRGQLKELFRLSKEEQLDIVTLKGSYAGAMGYGQFIPSSYRHYAVDFSGDKQRNILTNADDAIGSVANYFSRHGWLAGKPVTAQVSLQKELDESLFELGLKPAKTLREWAQLGVEIPISWAGLDMDQKATLMKMEKESAVEYWLGLENFYVITRYNHSALYAMAVLQLSQEVFKARQAAAK